jgi:hypothetical protein
MRVFIMASLVIGYIGGGILEGKEDGRIVGLATMEGQEVGRRECPEGQCMEKGEASEEVKKRERNTERSER